MSLALSFLAEAEPASQHGGFGTALFIGIFFILVLVALMWWLGR